MVKEEILINMRQKEEKVGGNSSRLVYGVTGQDLKGFEYRVWAISVVVEATPLKRI